MLVSPCDCQIAPFSINLLSFYRQSTGMGVLSKDGVLQERVAGMAIRMGRNMASDKALIGNFFLKII